MNGYAWDGYEWMTCLQHMPFSKQQSWKLSGLRRTWSVPTKICCLKICKTCLLCSSKLLSAEKTCKIWFKHSQKSSGHQTQLGKSCRSCRFVGLLAFLFSASRRDSREHSNHGSFCRQFYCDLLCLYVNVFNMFYDCWKMICLCNDSLG